MGANYEEETPEFFYIKCTPSVQKEHHLISVPTNKTTFF
jgi:hypothetical protein